MVHFQKGNGTAQQDVADSLSALASGLLWTPLLVTLLLRSVGMALNIVSRSRFSSQQTFLPGNVALEISAGELNEEFARVLSVLSSSFQAAPPPTKKKVYLRCVHKKTRKAQDLRLSWPAYFSLKKRACTRRPNALSPGF